MEGLTVAENVLTTSPEIGIISEALAKAQSEITVSEKDAINPHFRSQYSTLSSSFKAGKSATAKNGLAVLQASGFTEGLVTVVTVVTHKSNQWIKNILRLPVNKIDIHTIKSAITYGRRIGYDGLLGIAPGDDEDDGNKAAEPPAKEAKTHQTKMKKLRAEMNKVFSDCKSLPRLEKEAKVFKGSQYGFWEKATYHKAGETFGKLFLAHKERIENADALYTEEGHQKWRTMLFKSDTEGFIGFYKNFKEDAKRQTKDNEDALQFRAQDLGLWDEHNKTFLIEDGGTNAES